MQYNCFNWSNDPNRRRINTLGTETKQQKHLFHILQKTILFGTQAMERWKSHVRAELFQRDCQQKEPFSGLIKSYSRLLEKCELHECFWDEKQGSRFVESPETLQLQLLLKEGEQVREKLAQRVTDLMSSLYLKEAELQYCHSQVSRYHKEALSLARSAGALQSSLLDCEFALESQSKELAALQAEQGTRGAELTAARREVEHLLERWMEEKREEAERVNEHNSTQERWHRFTSQLAKHCRRGGQQQRGEPEQLTWTPPDTPATCEETTEPL
ncbi:autophagy-related protein 16-1 isoform X1 [Anguilla anguilla]|uniref:autophagy-related protein 16-1 isoform X1 n=2 Tax=Anguilla anguilla TaxID=7936 RepID=UPI0015A82D06|nr:autophagy-related protein 16-1 isoform X1 [Anguilla anguilla]